jgi:hypothetical protein
MHFKATFLTTFFYITTLLKRVRLRFFRFQEKNIFVAVEKKIKLCSTGLSSLGVPGLADQLTLFQPGGTDYALLITTGTPGF